MFECSRSEHYSEDMHVIFMVIAIIGAVADDHFTDLVPIGIHQQMITIIKFIKHPDLFFFIIKINNMSAQHQNKILQIIFKWYILSGIFFKY